MQDGKRMLYATCGDGSVVGVNARTGERYGEVPLGKSGINASVLVYKNERVIAIYGTPYEPGQMVAFKIPKVTPHAPYAPGRGRALESGTLGHISPRSPVRPSWSAIEFMSSAKKRPCCVDVNGRPVLWKLKIGIEQRNSCPVVCRWKDLRADAG